jgi:hypothetical protein
MIAIRKRTKDNPPAQLQEREYPNDSKPLAEIVMEGQFKKYWLVICYWLVRESLYSNVL